MVLRPASWWLAGKTATKGSEKSVSDLEPGKRPAIAEKSDIDGAVEKRLHNLR